MLEYQRIYADKLTTICQPGEQVLAIVSTTYVSGDEHIGPPDRGVSFDLINGLSVARWDAAAFRLVGGVSISGLPGGLAVTMRDSVAPHALADVVLTNQRLLVVVGVGGTDPISVLWGCARSAVACIRHEPCWNQRGRLTLAFTDGSLVRPVAGFVFGRGARRFAEAASTQG